MGSLRTLWCRVWGLHLGLKVWGVGLDLYLKGRFGAASGLPKACMYEGCRGAASSGSCGSVSLPSCTCGVENPRSARFLNRKLAALHEESQPYRCFEKEP